MKKRFSSPETLMAHLGEDRGEDRGAHHGAVIPPLYQNSLFTFRDWDDIDAAFENRTERPIYSRLSNPTTTVAEKKVAALAGEGAACRLFSSGMAAISAAIFHAVSAGDHVVAVKNVYGPTNNFLNTYLSDKLGLTTGRGDDCGHQKIDERWRRQERRVGVPQHVGLLVEVS